MGGLCFFPVVWPEAVQSPSVLRVVGSMAGVMVTSAKRAVASRPRLPGLLLPVPLSAQLAAARDSHTPRQVWLRLLGGYCPFLLSPGAHKVLPLSPVL